MPANTTTGFDALRAKAARIADALAARFPSLVVPLQFGSHFQLLVAVLLSAQTTDKAVNAATPALFAAAPTAERMAALGEAAIKPHIATLGLSNVKARQLAALSRQLVERHGGAVPRDWEALEALPGVGHKTASVVMLHAFNEPALPVDTHVHRLALRWGLAPPDASVAATEAVLKRLFPRETWGDVHLRMVLFGREACPARGHDPARCPVCAWAAAPAEAGAGTGVNVKPAPARATRKRGAAG